MYERHFGFNKRLFPTAAVGSDVFVGPQTAVVMAALKKALTNRDAVATVTGPAGSGKTTLVTRALQAIGGKHIIVHVARMRLDSHDVLTLLTDALGLRDLPHGTIQRFTALRKRLTALESEGTRVFVVVEDTLRLSPDTVAELEALTAADAGESEGASVVLMGDEQLNDYLRGPLLARLRQRIRHRQTIAPLGAAELRGYLKHRFRSAGGDFERVFRTDAAATLHDLSGGIPRVANNLVESLLRSAAAKGFEQVPQQLLLDIAKEEYQLSAAEALPVLVKSPAEPSPPEARPQLAAKPPPVIAATRAPKPIPVIADLLPKAAVMPKPVPAEPVDVLTETQENTGPDTDIPALIEDTLPNLTILAPVFDAKFEDVPELVSEPEPDTTLDDWDRESTMAELRPDLDALEQAMAVATGSKTEVYAAPNPAADQEAPPAAAPEVIPEITLDKAIKLRLEDSNVGKPEKPCAAATPDSNATDSDSSIEKITAELAKARSLEEIDDRTAETLFGGELDAAAAQFTKKSSASEPSNGDSKPANGDAETSVHSAPRARTSSTSTRLRTVQALNVGGTTPPTIVEPETIGAPANEEPGKPAPSSVEDQMNTSITQTLKALRMRPPEEDEDEDEDEDAEENKGGFFSRFKRS